MTIRELSIEEIRQLCGSETSTEEAERFRDRMLQSEYADTPTNEIPEREWLRILCEDAP